MGEKIWNWTRPLTLVLDNFFHLSTRKPVQIRQFCYFQHRVTRVRVGPDILHNPTLHFIGPSMGAESLQNRAFTSDNPFPRSISHATSFFGRPKTKHHATTTYILLDEIRTQPRSWFTSGEELSVYFIVAVTTSSSSSPTITLEFPEN